MELANKIMNARKGAVKKIFKSWTSYPHVLFLDASNHVQEQLKYIINTSRQNKIRDFVYDNFGRDTESLYVAHTKDRKNEIMDCTNCNLIAIDAYKTVTDKEPI